MCLTKIIEGEIQVGGQEYFYLETHSNLVWTTDIFGEAPVFHPTEEESRNLFATTMNWSGIHNIHIVTRGKQAIFCDFWCCFCGEFSIQYFVLCSFW